MLGHIVYVSMILFFFLLVSLNRLVMSEILHFTRKDTEVLLASTILFILCQLCMIIWYETSLN